MKVTALIPDDLVGEVQELAHGKTLTESLIIALKEWRSIQKLRSLKNRIKSAPLSFRRGYSASRARAVNRQR